MVVYRISKCPYIDNLSGEGASKYGGRWNSKGVAILYTASSAALAMLESVVHLSKLSTPDFCLASIDVPVTKIATIGPNNLPNDWRTNPPPDHLKKIGDQFIASGQSLVLRIPSVIMPTEFNYLINPSHPDFGIVKILSQQSLDIDSRLIPN
jgi:RES domain-containing protein